MHVSNMINPKGFYLVLLIPYSLFALGLCIWVVLLSLHSQNMIMLILINDLWNQWLK